MAVVTVQARSPGSVRDEAARDAIARVYPGLYSFARYLLGISQAEDAVGEALEHLWRQRDRLPAGDDAAAERWAMRVGINRIRDEGRRQRRRPIEIPIDDIEVAVDDAADRRARLAELRAAIGRLPTRDAQLVGLRFGIGLANDEIGDVLGMTPGAVAVALHRAIRRLTGLMHEERT